MGHKNWTNFQTEDAFNIGGMYFLEYTLLKNKYAENSDDLLNYISSIIEAITIQNCINDVDEEHLEYLKAKNREIMWLAAKSRFRAKNNLIPRL
ncbi:hypothetical protein [Methanobacterium oryzae]|uniref:hypothetical protein n=1 Tax=Methanobacterium oryzae TaxID=69540 RepID=UPI003D1D3834